MLDIIDFISDVIPAKALLHGAKINKNSSWRSHVVAVAIQLIPNIMRDLIRILNKFSIKICFTGWPRCQKAPRHDGWGSHTTMPPCCENDISRGFL